MKPNQKKAMSPLFSTVILIFFAIALGGVVMSWGKSGYTTERSGLAECEKTSLSLMNYGANKGVCYKENRLYFTIQNNGEINLDGIKISIMGNSQIYSTMIRQKINSADIVQLNLEYSDVGEIEKVIFVPAFDIENKEKVCPKNGFSAEEIGEC